MLSARGQIIRDVGGGGGEEGVATSGSVFRAARSLCVNKRID